MLIVILVNHSAVLGRCGLFALLWSCWKYYVLLQWFLNECLSEFLGQKQVLFIFMRVQAASALEHDFPAWVGDLTLS